MKLSVLTLAVVLAVLFSVTGILYAANGDLIVNGNLGVGTGTATPTEKAEVRGNMKVEGTITSNGQNVNGNLTVNQNLCVGGNCTNTLHVSGGLYGICTQNWTYGGCKDVISPAFCNMVGYSGICACPSGYTPVGITFNSYGVVITMTCIKQ